MPIPLTDRLQAARDLLAGLAQPPRHPVRLAVMWLALALLSVSGALRTFDGWLFDAFVRLPPHGAPVARVAIVVDDPARREGGTRMLTDLGARHVLIYERALPGARDGCALVPEHGMVRTVPLRDADGAPCPLLHWSQRLGLDVPGSRAVSPDFSISTSTVIPRVPAARLADPMLAREAVQARIVLRVPGVDGARYATPLLASDGLLDDAVVHALALDALLRGSAVWAVPRGVDVLVAALAVLLLHAGTRRLRYRPRLTAVVLALLPYAALCALLLRWGGVHLPATAGLLAIALHALRIVLHRNRLLGDALGELDQRLTGLVQQPLDRAFDQAPELTWEQVNHFVAQFFDLQRSLMLRLPPGEVHLQPVSAIGCSADDIIEKRRDYRRAPYSDSLTRERPTVPSRPFLRAAGGLVDLVAPLVAADQLVGFWAFSVTERTASELDRLVVEAARYGEEVAKIVLRIRDAEPIDPEHRRLVPLAQVRARLLDAAARAREQLSAYRDVFAAVGHPIAVTDLLGRIQFANPRFEQLSTTVGQPLLAMSLHNMLEQLCGLEPAEAKDVLRRLVLHGAPEGSELPLRVPDLPFEYSLRLHPIRRQGRTATPTGSPFELLGLIVEISPTTPEADAAARALRASQRYAGGNRTMFEAMLRSLDRVPADFPARDVLSDKLVRGLDETRRVQRVLGAVLSREAGQPVALDLPQLLHRLRQAHLPEALRKDLAIVIEERGPRTVHAEGDALRTLLDDVFRLLVDDAAPGTAIEATIEAADDGLSAILQLGNRGYGLPADHVADVLHAAARGPVVGHAAPLDRVAQSMHQLDASTVFRIGSELGEGYRVTLVLPLEPPAA